MTAQDDAEQRAARDRELDDDAERAAVLTAQDAADAPTAALTTAAPSSHAAMVRIEVELVREHPAPRWLFLARLALTTAVAFLVPASGFVLAGLVLAVWIVSGVALRYPVELRPGRALFLGGLGNTGAPGRHWLRPRWTETAYSIPERVLRLEWRPAPTRLEHEQWLLWLEVELVAWVRPRTDSAGQFFALLRYEGWSKSSNRLAVQLRKEVMGRLVEQASAARVVEAAREQPVALADVLRRSLEPGLAELGWELVRLGRGVASVAARTEDLRVEDEVRLEAGEPPA